ncbi:hypothetical protein FB45DRAFT_1035216 [Roridomyces roridus]|uniref:Uncharacterized protein n=1 Tax=Roridomyces roridus TaxID=1738132 RepID=A0AAD7FCP2_9AGAR|nr:hypothetical protein FB45DRAFT_1035216 [Roridomyces roridus]
MLFNAALSLLFVSLVAAVPQDVPSPFTVTRTFKTITDVAPFIVTQTTVFTFTPSPTTSIAFPTGSPI